jgi:hypothetical protein
MSSISKILLKNNYARLLLRRATWTEAWLSLRRAGKDKRARKHLFALSLVVLTPVFLIAYLAWLVGTGAIFFVPFVIPVIWLIRRGHKNQDTTTLRIAPAPEPVAAGLTDAQRRAIRQHLATLAVVYAVFLDRAGSETFLKHNEIPSGKEVLSRRMHLELLKKIGAWERLAQADREALIEADGNWEWPRINQTALSIEPLRLLRWILQVDSFLPLVGQQMQVDYRLAHELVVEPGKVLEGRALASVAAMETGRDAARSFLFRCIAELISRGCHEARNEEIRKWATEASSSMRGNQDEDLLLGEHLVSEASDDEVRWAATLSRARASFLEWTIAVLEGTAAVETQFAAVS